MSNARTLARTQTRPSRWSRFVSNVTELLESYNLHNNSNIALLAALDTISPPVRKALLAALAQEMIFYETHGDDSVPYWCMKLLTVLCWLPKDDAGQTEVFDCDLGKHCNLSETESRKIVSQGG